MPAWTVCLATALSMKKALNLHTWGKWAGRMRKIKDDRLCPLDFMTLKTFNFMTITDFYDFCLAKAGVTEHFPFDEDTLVTYLKMGQVLLD